MRTSLLCLATLTCLAPAAAAQSGPKAILFTGRFPFVSTDALNYPNSAIAQMTEYDFSYSVPLPGAPIAGRTLMPATAMHCYLGDGDQNGDYLKFRTWKPSYFTNIGIDGVFVKHPALSGVTSPTWQDVFWTPRLDGAAGPIEVLTNNGTPVTLQEGDWLRFRPNGNAEFFMTRQQYGIAAGVQVNPGSDNPGIGAIAQDAAGNLYLAPADLGHWVNGNQGGGFFAQDGAILKIDAANITYDGNGNVAAFAPDSARILINESLTGPGGTLTVRGMVDNSGAIDRTGVPVVTAGIYGKTGGLGLDPNGGTWTPMYPDAAGNFPAEPNLVFCSNAGSYGGTIWTTNNQGEVLEINNFGNPGQGVLCGSTTAGVPADGSWLGVQLDITNFQPTLLGMTIIDLPTQQLIADQGDFGRLATSASQPTWTVDLFGPPNTAVFGLVAVGPQPPAIVVPSFSVGFLPLPFDPLTWPDLFFSSLPIDIGLAITDAEGYASLSVPNPNTGAFPGFTFMVQGLGLAANFDFQLTSPMILQLQ